MGELTKAEAREFLAAAFANLLDPQQPVESLLRHYAETCTQEIDGARIDFSQFLDHARALKRSIRSGRVTFEEFIVEGERIAAVYVVETESIHGGSAKLKVIAFITIADGRIASLTELTHPMKA